MMGTHKSWKLYVGWLSINLFFMYIYALRVSSGLMFGELRQEFLMTGEQFGIFVACYLYSYSLMQVPLGILLDRIGIRKVVLGAFAVVFLSVWILAHAKTLYVAYFSRVLLGLGSACGLMSCLKFASDRMPSHLRGIFMGLSLSMGTLGALTAGNAIPEMLKIQSWRDVLEVALYGGLPILALVVLFIPKDNPAKDQSESVHWGQIGQTVLTASRNWHILLYGILSIGCYTPLATIADSWGAAFLKEKYAWDAAKAGSTVMYMYIGLSIGSILLPWMSRWWGDYNRVIQYSLLGLSILFALVLYAPALSEWQLMGLLLLIGVLCGSEIMCFTGASHYTTPQTSGVTLGLVNTFNMLGGAFINQAVGKVLDVCWCGDTQGCLRIYSADNYQTALSVLWSIIVLSLVFSIKLEKPKKSDLIKA